MGHEADSLTLYLPLSSVCFFLPVLSYQSALELRGQVIPILALIETLPSSMWTN